MPSGIQTSRSITIIIIFMFLHLGILVQDLHHRCPLLFVLDQHAASAANVFNNIDDFAEARGSAAGLCEAREAEIGAASVFEYDEEFDDKGHGLDLEVCKVRCVSIHLCELQK
jgi:hypothetical protein